MKRLIYILTILLVFLTQRSKATHSMGLDLTYECLDGNQYVVTLSFYRDCEGVAAPTAADVDFFSSSCGQSYSETLPLFSVTELGTVCASLQTTCSGGTYPGAEEYIYRDTITLPVTCTDWELSYTLCCRNNAINTINNPGNQDIYVEATLDNTGGLCNSSPVFTNTPVPFICVGGSYCFNNGANDVDGDSLVYSLVVPTTGPGASDTVDYIVG